MTSDPSREESPIMTTTADPGSSTTTDRYTIISADTHAGGSHEEHRAYLAPEFLDDFDAWRGQYKNPWKDRRDTDLRVRNWDDARRDADQLTDGAVGEVVFPNTVPPFSSGFVLFAGPPTAEEYEHRRAGIGQFFLNDLDDAIADITWIKENALREHPNAALLKSVGASLN
jgi:hypothetical protein